MSARVPARWALHSLGSLLKESRVAGSDGAVAKKITIRLHAKGAVAKLEKRPGSVKTKYYRRFAGQLIYSKLDFLNGAVAILPPELDGRESTADLPAFDLSPKVDPRWLIEFIGRPSFYRQQFGLARGSRGALRLRQKEFLGIKILVPPLAEQQGIVKVLERFDRASAAAQEVQARTEKVRRQMLSALIMGKMSQGRFKDSGLGEIPEHWELLRLQDLKAPGRQCVMTGPYGALLNSADFEASGVGVLKIGNLQEGRIRRDCLDYVSTRKAGELQRYRLEAGDLVLARQGATTGKVALVDAHCQGYLMSAHLLRVAVDQKRCLPGFLWAYFCSAQLGAQLEIRKIKGTREGINSRDLRSIQLPLPPICEQAEIVTRTRRFFETLGSQKRALEQLGRLKSRVREDLMLGRVRT